MTCSKYSIKPPRGLIYFKHIWGGLIWEGAFFNLTKTIVSVLKKELDFKGERLKYNKLEVVQPRIKNKSSSWRRNHPGSVHMKFYNRDSIKHFIFYYWRIIWGRGGEGLLWEGRFNRGFTVGLVSELLIPGYGLLNLSLAAHVVRWSVTSHSQVALTTLTRSNTAPLSSIIVFSQASSVGGRNHLRVTLITVKLL